MTGLVLVFVVVFDLMLSLGGGTGGAVSSLVDASASRNLFN